jgi:phosphomannomutase
MDGRGQFVDPHRIMALALKYLVEERGWTGKVVKTVSTTQMVNRLCRNYGLEVIETPVGFNHIANLILTDDILIGGEESGGICFKGHIPEGDGVLMGLLLVEMVCKAGLPLERLVEDLLKQVGPAHYQRIDLRLPKPISKERMVQKLLDIAPDSIGGQGIENVSAHDGVKYVLKDDSWLLIRPSGTEPVLRVYAEARTPEALEALLGYGQEVARDSS